MPPIRSLTALILLAGLLAGCGSNRADLARLAPYGVEPREPCGATTRGISLRDIDDDVEDWSIADGTEELGPPQLAKDEAGIRRAGWYDVTIGQQNCGTLLSILERDKQRIVVVQDLKPHQIWQVLDGKFPDQSNFRHDRVAAAGRRLRPVQPSLNPACIVAEGIYR